LAQANTWRLDAALETNPAEAAASGWRSSGFGAAGGGLLVVLTKGLSKGEEREVVVAPTATATVAATPWATAGVMPPSDALPA
jgi:hypothetical protein